MEPLIIVGASARAAAFSALRAGFQPHCADLFADVDLAARCQVQRVTAYPQGLESAIESLPAAAWLFTGALENYPEVVQRIAAKRALLGNPADVLRRVRQPAVLDEALRDGPCRFPDWQPTPAGLPTDGTWLRKGYRSAGGALVKLWRGGGWDRTKHYFQRRVEGRPAAAVYVAAAGRATLLGVTEQLVGAVWTGAAPFHYAGSLGPRPLTDAQHAAVLDLGQRLAGLQLRGLFGVDVLLAPRGVYAVDVNPRFPASVEVLERVDGFSAVGLHVEACREGRCTFKPQAAERSFHGKAILFAQRRCVIGHEFARLSQAAMKDQRPAVADVPAEGSVIEAGRPVMTVFAEAPTWGELEPRLRAAIEKWRAVPV